MKKFIVSALSALLLAGCLTFGGGAYAASEPASYASHTVVRGDTLWKIAVRWEVGVDELIAANPQFKNPNLIYPGQTVNIPLDDPRVAAFEREVAELVNDYRAEYGLSPLTLDWELSRVARYKSQDMHDNRYFSHVSPVYGSPFTMMKSFGLSYRSAGENIAMGYSTPEAVMRGWINSSGHRANILNASFTRIGVGYVADGNYWTQMFIG